MRLSKNNIKHVTVHVRDGQIYEVFVAMKSNMVSDSRTYTGEALKHLPASVKAFTQSHTETVVAEWEQEHIKNIKFA